MVIDPPVRRLFRTVQTPGAARRTLPATVLVLAALIALTVSLIAVLRRRTAGGDPDLGWVSERWLAEYRADSTRPSL
jgi:hypothetical protein